MEKEISGIAWFKKQLDAFNVAHQRGINNKITVKNGCSGGNRA
jgi:hypothetical protein